MSPIRLLLLLCVTPTLACGGALITEEVDLDGVIAGDDLEDVREAPDDAARCDAACLILLDAELGHVTYRKASVWGARTRMRGTSRLFA
jgi:hypothetical protein